MEGSSVARFKEILKVFTSYGLGYLLGKKEEKEKKSPSNLRKAFEELGPTFIKIGQILSTRQELIPEEYIIELSKLQDNVASDKFEDMAKVFYDEFNKNIEDEFLYINKEAIAAASVAQVYRGILKNGQDVVIKIQRPNIKETMMMDFDILLILSEKFDRVFKESVVDPKEILLEIKSSAEKELNFIYEANNVKKFREFNKDIPCIYAPFIIDEYTSEKVITQENIEGFKINDKVILNELGYDKDDIAKKLTLSYFKQVLKDGFFAETFPVNKAESAKIRTKKLPLEVGEVSETFQCAFENSGIMKNGIIYTIKTVPDYHGKQITLGDVMETGQVEEQYFIPEEKLYYTNPEVTHSDETGQRLPKEDRQTWQYLKGAKKLLRTSSTGHEYVFSEGAISMIDQEDKPARTMLTSEGGFSRTTHIVRDKMTGRVRLLTAAEAERIQGFPTDHTKYCLVDGKTVEMPLRKRRFMMGNALVVNLVEDMEKILEKIFDVE